jgi:WD40 repeat protein
MGRTANLQDARRARVDLLDGGGTRRWQTPIQTTAVCALAYDPDGRTLFSCGRTDLAPGGALWDVATGRLVRPLLGPLGRVGVRAAVYEPGGGRLLLTCDDGRVHLWDVSTDSEVGPERPLAPAAPVTVVACDAAGTRLLTGSRDGTAHLWDLRTGSLLLPPLRHEAEVSVVAFSPDGRTLLTGSLDGAGRFWDAGSGEPLGATRWHRTGVSATCYHPAGGRVATAIQDGTVYQWPAPAPPRAGSPDHVRLWVEVLTGLELDDQRAVHELPPSAVVDRRGRLEEMEAPPAGPHGDGRPARWQPR